MIMRMIMRTKERRTLILALTVAVSDFEKTELDLFVFIQRIAPSIVMNNDTPLDGVEEWLSSNKQESVKQEIY